LISSVNRLDRWQRQTLYVTGALLALTGVLWLAVHYTIGAGAGQMPHPIETWSMRLHGLAAFGGLFVFGVLSASHITRGWLLTRQDDWTGQRKTGIALCVLAGFLALTGYLLYYFAPEELRPALGWIHSAAGLAMGVLIGFHQRDKHAV
jgi:hypothetical protein